MRTHDTLKGGTVARIAKMRRYRDEWNAKQASGNKRYSYRTRLDDGIAGILQARSHGIGSILVSTHGPTFSKCGNYASIPSDVLDGLRDCGTVPDILGHRYGGWYADAFQDETYTGNVWQLPARNGEPQFIAGYVEQNSGYAVLDATRGRLTLFDDREDAARAADGLAERHAERNREHDERWQEASRHDSEREDARSELKDARMSAQANIACMRELLAIGADSNAIGQTRAMLESYIAKNRANMRRAIATIERETAAIAELDMQGEF